jgi:diguanylate cyclase (GGDEF)-like protein
MRVELPTYDTDKKMIAFETNHFEVEAYIDDECVYTLKVSNPKFSKSTGYHWNFIRLKEVDAGKALKIRLISHYAKSPAPIKSVYYGGETSIYREICTTNAFRFFSGCIIMLVGIVMLAYVYLTPERKNKDFTMKYFAWFTISLSVWTITESPITYLISDYPTANMVIDHYALMFMLITYLLFIRNLFKEENNIACNICICISVITPLLRTVLQVASVCDLEESLWLTHIAIAFFVLVSLPLCVRELISGTKTRWEKINIICILITVASTFVELVMFLISGKTGIYGMLCFVVYIVATSIEMIKRSQTTIARAQEVEIYEKLAYTDALTGIYNRMAFINDMENHAVADDKSDVLFMIDLNDLKTCNDNFGHEYGDKYIKLVADTLKEVFINDGSCYRMGGDEFCVVMNCGDKDAIKDKLKAVDDNFKELNKKGFVVPVSAAVGYAVSDKWIDKSLEDTLKRADTMMYKNKQKTKKR